MSTHHVGNFLQTDPAIIAITRPANWYAIQTRSRHERLVAHQLQSHGVAHYLPIVTEQHRWSDRRKKVEVPLFSGYVFVRIVPSNEERGRVLRINGVVSLVGNSPEGTPIPEEQMESVRMLVEQKVLWMTHPFLKSGQRIRVRGGALDGVEGIFQMRNGEDTLIVSIDAIQRSMSVSIKGYDIEVV